MKVKKGFDCVEMKRHAQEKINKETKGMSIDEQLTYWKMQEKAFRREIAPKGRTSRRAKTTRV